MKHLKKFEDSSYGWRGLDAHHSNSPFIKNFGEEYPIQNLKPGQKIVYAAGTYYVLSVDEVIINLSKTPDGPKEFTVNQQMFNEKGAIRKSDN